MLRNHSSKKPVALTPNEVRYREQSERILQVLKPYHAKLHELATVQSQQERVQDDYQVNIAEEDKQVSLWMERVCRLGLLPVI